MKVKKIFLLLILTLLFIGLSYATEVSNDTTNTMDTSIADSNKEVVQSSNTPIKEINNTIKDKRNTKEISKQNNKTIKSGSKSYDINNFNMQHDENFSLKENNDSIISIDSSINELANTENDWINVYFDASASIDGNGSIESPYKFIRIGRIKSNSNNVVVQNPVDVFNDLWRNYFFLSNRI